MSFISWSEDISVGIDEIDEQHKKLLRLINSLHQRLVAGDANDIMGKVLDRVADYAEFHFSTEEQWMAQYSYPDIAQHIDDHRQFIVYITALQNRLRNDHGGIAEETMAFLTNWLSRHILEADMALGKYQHATANPALPNAYSTVTYRTDTPVI
jgi:hemerythrin